MKAAIFDLDNTLIDEDDGEEKIIGPVKKLSEFVNENQEYLTIILTARAENVRDETKKLLEEKNIDFDELYMRPSEDFSLPDEKFKESVLDKLRDRGLDIDFVVEDKGSVADMWKENSIDCLKMPENHATRHKLIRYLRKIYGKMPKFIQQTYLKMYKNRFEHEKHS